MLSEEYEDEDDEVEIEGECARSRNAEQLFDEYQTQREGETTATFRREESFNGSDVSSVSENADDEATEGEEEVIEDEIP